MKYARILGTGSYLPSKRVTNDELAQRIDTSDEWIKTRTGISARHIAAEEETCASLAIEAAKAALNASGISAQTLDMILVATCTPDRMFPSTACFVQNALGLRNIPAFDVSAACAGFMYALSIANQYVRTESAKRILVIGSEVMSRIVDWNDRGTCVLFGDGAGAVVLGADDKPGIHSTHLHADGCLQDILFLPNDIAAPSLKNHSPYLQMQGSEVFKVAVRELEKVVIETLHTNHFAAQEIDWLIPHQANIRIIQNVAKHLKLPLEQVILTVDEHANTSSASIPLALDVAVRDGRIQRGQKLLLEGIGGGMVWGSALITF